MPNGVVSNPKVFVSIGGDGTVSIVAARAEMGNGAARTALPMMVADELEADWARVRVVQSPGDERTYGNQDTDGSRSVRHWIQPMRHCGAAMRHDAGDGGGRDVEGRRQRGAGTAARGRAQAVRAQARIRRACRRGRRPAGPAGRQGQAQGGQRLPLHRQGHRAHRRPRRHYDRQGDLRPGCHAARHEVRRHRQAAGGRRQGGVPRLERRLEGAGRGEGGDASRHAGALQVRAARWRCRHRQQHLGGTEGSRGAQDHLGRRAQQGPRLQGLPGAARGGREEARQGRARRRRCREGSGLRCEGDHSASTTRPTSPMPPWSRRRRRRA